MTIRGFIKENKNDFDRYRSKGTWNGYKVYSVWAKCDEGACIGYPKFALEKDGIIRLASIDETYTIMKRFY